jgi:hypothetical protein
VNDSTALLLLLVAVYLADCLTWVPPATLGVAQWLGTSRLRRPLRPSHRGRRGFVLAPPWPPQGSLWLAEPWPQGLGPTGILTGLPGGLAPDEPLAWQPWTSWRAVQADGPLLRLHGKVRFRTGTRSQALHLAGLLRDLTDLTPQQRRKRLDQELDRRWDLPALHRTHRHVMQATRRLRTAETILFLGLFALLPALLLTPAIEAWRVLLPALTAMWLGTLVVFEWTVRRAGLAKPAWNQRLTVLLSPLSALRAHDLWTIEALARHDPLALAAALLPRERARPLLARGLAELHWPLAAPARAQSGEDDAWWQKAQILRLERTLAGLGLDPAELLAPPIREDPTSRQWCPRCRSQYEARAQACATCPGVPLQELA